MVPGSNKPNLRYIGTRKTAVFNPAHELFKQAGLGGPHAVEFVRNCVETGAVHVNTRNPGNGRSLLHEACSCGDKVMVKMLVEELGANINFTAMMGGCTPLHTAGGFSYLIRNMYIQRLTHTSHFALRPGCCQLLEGSETYAFI